MITKHYSLVIKGANPLSRLIGSGWDYISDIEKAHEERRITDLTEDTQPDARRFKLGNVNVTFLPGYQEGHLEIETEHFHQQRTAVTKLIPLLDPDLEAIPAWT